METRPGTDRGAGYDPSVQGAPLEKASVVEDFIDIFYAPSRVFARREKSGFWTHLLIISAIAALFAFANRGVFDQIFDVEFQRGAAKAMEANPQITEDMLAQQRKISGAIAGFFQYIGVPLLVFVVSLLVWGFARVVSAKFSYGQAVMIMTLAYIPRLVQGLLATIQGLLTDTSTIGSMHSVGFSPARFMDPDTTNRALLGLMGRLDLFTLWTTVLIAIGIAVIGKVPRARAAIAAGLVWLLPTLFSLRS
ncbi:MAG: YIP1 family protein [Gemmatimonadaceae bacterium]